MSQFTKEWADKVNAKKASSMVVVCRVTGDDRKFEAVSVDGVSVKQPSTNLVMKPSTDEAKLNKTERAFLRELRMRFPTENIGIQNITLKLADDCRFTPDFNSIDANGQQFFWETKGFFRDDAKVKLKVAARMFRNYRFVLVKRNGLGWTEEEVKP